LSGGSAPGGAFEASIMWIMSEWESAAFVAIFAVMVAVAVMA
jgi:hypothetical protein